MIVYRPIPTLTLGRPGVVSAFVAMALTALLGTSWMAGKSSTAQDNSPAPDRTAETAGDAETSHGNQQ